MSSRSKRKRDEPDSADSDDDIDSQLRRSSQLRLHTSDYASFSQDVCQLQSQLEEESRVQIESQLTVTPNVPNQGVYQFQHHPKINTGKIAQKTDLQTLQTGSSFHIDPLSSSIEGVGQLQLTSNVNTVLGEISYSQAQSIQLQPSVAVNAGTKGESQLQHESEIGYCTAANLLESSHTMQGPKLFEIETAQNVGELSNVSLNLDSTLHVGDLEDGCLNLDSALNVEENLTKEEFMNQESLLHIQHGLDLTQSWEGEEELKEMFSLMLLNPEDREYEAEQSEEEDEEDNAPVSGKPLLYPGAPLTLHESFVSILTLALTFKLSGAALQGVLNLIAIHLPNNVKKTFKKSLSFFKKYFSFVQGPKSFEYYCSKCFKKCADRSGCDICKSSKVCYLVQLSLIEQLQTMLKRDGFYNKLSIPEEKEATAYQDIYSGSVYKSMVNEKYLGEKGQLSGQIYTDGAALYESANVSVWPVYITINELPYEERFKKQNILLPVIWCGPTKPPANLLLAAAYPDLSVLANGIKMEAKNIGEVEVTLTVVAATGDTPARSLMLNMCQFNGANSCQCCEQPGVPRPDCPGVRYFPFKPSEMDPRTLDSMKTSGAVGTEKTPHLGVKGPTVLANLMPNFVHGMAIDPQHHLYAGCGKKVLKLLMDTSAKAKKWSISKFIVLINEKLLSISPPAHIPRVARALSELSYWKLSELKAWLQHYSLPVMEGVLPNKYLKHHATLVAAVQLLSAEIVTLNDISTARKLLNEYVAQFADFFHPHFMTINIHLLLHLPDLVIHLGPLWVYSCFPLEGVNGQILNLVHGTRWAEKQIASSVQLTLGLPDMVANLRESEAKKFCEKLLRPRRYGGTHIGDAIIVGKTEDIQLEQNIVLSLKDNYGISASRAKRFPSLKQGKYLYVSTLNKISKCRDSSTAVFVFNDQIEVGSVQYFIDVKTCNCKLNCECSKNIFVVIKKLTPIRYFETLLENVNVPNTFAVTYTNDVRVVPKTALSSVCICMVFNGIMYLSKEANNKESE